VTAAMTAKEPNFSQKRVDFFIHSILKFNFLYKWAIDCYLAIVQALIEGTSRAVKTNTE